MSHGENLVFLPDGKGGGRHARSVDLRLTASLGALLPSLLYVIPQIDEAKRALAKQIGDKPW